MPDLRYLFSSALLIASTAAAQGVPITSGPFNDYQPSVIRSSDDGARIVVFERLDASTSGDLWITRSSDDGVSWTPPVAIIASSANERHAALLQLGPSSYVVFYLKARARPLRIASGARRATTVSHSPNRARLTSAGPRAARSTRM